MKKIAIILLALALLLPTLSIAAEAPTFDFTAEEWLARYQEVVGEDKPYWFGEFNGFPATKNMPKEVLGHYWIEEEDGALYAEWSERNSTADIAVSLVKEWDNDKVSTVNAVCSLLSYKTYMYYSKEVQEKRFVEYLELCCAVMMVTDPALTKDEAEAILNNFNIGYIQDGNELIGFGKSVDFNGYSYVLGEENGAYAKLEIVPKGE